MISKLLNRFKNKANSPEQNSSKLMGTYNRLPVSFEKGEGIRLWDENSKEYIDALGGIAVTILGHKHPEFTQALNKATDSLLHVSNLYQIPEQEALGKKLCEIAGMDKAFLCNSGAEANEAALKIARKFGNDQGISMPTVITAENSFHGRTMAALAATGNAFVKQGFEPMLSGFEHVPYNDADAIAALSDNENIVAVMLESIQGEAGIVVPDAGYLAKVRQICDDNNWLLICDEIQAGMGRTGKWFGFQHDAIEADVVTVAKALGNGIPIGACLARGKAAEVLQAGHHGTTFGGNPFASSVALAVINTLEKHDLVSHMQEMGEYLLSTLELYLGENKSVVDIRGKGMMLAIELDHVYDNLVQQFLDEGLVVNITGGGKVVRLLPAAIMQRGDADRIAKIIARVLNANEALRADKN